MKPVKSNIFARIAAVILPIAIVMGTAALLQLRQLPSFDSPVAIGQVPGELKTIERIIPEASYPEGELFVDNARSGYRDGELRLVVPRMQLDCEVLDGVDAKTLERGVGLYDNAQLPALGNPNVSIAGHRDIHGSPFLTIDKLAEGDSLYLVQGDNVYHYLWEQTITVQPDEWSVIYCTDYSRITLTSCDPIGTTQNRIIAIGRLESVNEYTDSYSFE